MWLCVNTRNEFAGNCILKLETRLQSFVPKDTLHLPSWISFGKMIDMEIGTAACAGDNRYHAFPQKKEIFDELDHH